MHPISSQELTSSYIYHTLPRRPNTHTHPSLHIHSLQSLHLLILHHPQKPRLAQPKIHGGARQDLSSSVSLVFSGIKSLVRDPGRSRGEERVEIRLISSPCLHSYGPTEYIMAGIYPTIMCYAWLWSLGGYNGKDMAPGVYLREGIFRRSIS